MIKSSMTNSRRESSEIRPRCRHYFGAENGMDEMRIDPPLLPPIPAGSAIDKARSKEIGEY